MHDIKSIRDNPAAFDAALKRRGLQPLSASLLAIDEKRRAAILASEQAQARRNAASKEIGDAKKAKDDARAAAPERQISLDPTGPVPLEADGDAKKTHGEEHGTWTLVDGQARIAWDDGWHDVIRKVGAKHEKLAYEPGRSFDESPSNVTAARNTNPKPI